MFYLLHLKGIYEKNLLILKLL